VVLVGARHGFILVVTQIGTAGFGEPLPTVGQRSRVGATPEPPQLERVAARVQRGGIVAIGLAVLTPRVRTAAIPGCSLAGVPSRQFVPGLALGHDT
jgi:hypothetical protein